MKVSVVVPFHKGLSFLEDCLDSLVEQNYNDMEVLLVCDRVEEDVEEFIRPYQSKINLKLYYLEGGAGVAAARNYGLDLAQGEYIYFLDSDDYLAENTIELLVSTADENKYDLVYGKDLDLV